jgi:uncharacterized protein GlcG (DUF336 family)
MLNPDSGDPKRRTILGIEHLEDRDLPNPLNSLLSAITPSGTATLSTGKLTITDQSSAARIRVVLDDNTIEVYDGTTELGAYSSPSVSSITINVGAGGGSNEVIVDPKVTQPTTINAGAGSNKLVAGGGSSTLNGGSGSNVLIGGVSPTTFNAGSGSNTILNASPTDPINGANGNTKVLQNNPPPTSAAGDPAALTQEGPPLTASEVLALMDRAQSASAYNDAIIAVTDRNGNILGVRVESGVSTAITGNLQNYVFAIDGAVALARSGALFGNNQSPLTSRTVEFISQSTITQREVDSNPDVANQNSTAYGPGYVAPIGIGGHFPPNVNNTPQVDLFEIEQTNREGLSANGIPLTYAYNINPAYTSPNNMLYALQSYGAVTNTLPSAQDRGIATLPGGIPIVQNGKAIGGIGVFFPGTTGFATAENSVLSSGYNPNEPDYSQIAEWMAFAAVGGFSQAIGNAPVTPIGLNYGVAPNLPGFGLTDGTITLMGIMLPLVGAPGQQGFDNVFRVGDEVGRTPYNPTVFHSEDVRVDAGGDTLLPGKPTPVGWIVQPHSGVGISQGQVQQIVDQALGQAQITRAAIRLPLNTPAEFVIAVADNDGNIVGLYREPDATMFSVDVAIAKARNVDYYANPAELQPLDRVQGVPAGTAFTNRTFRYLAEPRFPEGIDGAPPAPFSQLRDGGASFTTGLQVGPVLPPSAFTTVLGYTSFHPDANFHDPYNLKNQNGVVYFPGSAPLYAPQTPGGQPQLAGGLGVSGDGVDEDDLTTTSGQTGFNVPPYILRADQVLVNNIRLPYQEFDRNPDLPS